LLGGVDARLGGSLQGVTEEVAAGVEGMALTGVEDLAVGGGLGQGMHLGDKGDGAFDGDALLLATILECSGRHDRASLASGVPPCLIPDPLAYFQRHTHPLAVSNLDEADPMK
jgi:hypothetical protein